MGKTKSNNKCLRLALLLITMLMAQTTWAANLAREKKGGDNKDLSMAAANTMDHIHTFADDDPYHTFCIVCNHSFLRYTATEKAGPNPTYKGNLKNKSNENIYNEELNFFDPKTGQGVIEFTEPLYTIGERVFNLVETITGMNIPNSVHTIGDDAFHDCNNLASVTIPNSVTYIGGQAFRGYLALKSVIIPSSVSTFKGRAFYDGEQLEEVTIKSLVKFTWSSHFTKLNNKTLYVPFSCLEYYKSADGWKNFGKIDCFEQDVEISTAEELNTFCMLVNEGKDTLNAKLTADIDFSAYGSSVINEYKGTFDGNGHTLTINIERKQDFAGPFYNLYGTVENLTVAGTIKTSKKFAGGIASQTKNGAVIQGCTSLVDIYSSVNGDGTHGGLIGCAEQPTTIDNCVFAGSINGADTDKCAGFVGWCTNPTTITNSLLVGDLNIKKDGINATFGRSSSNLTLTNCYYKEKNGGKVEGATQITDEQLASGEVCYKLNGSKSNDVCWYQSIGTDNRPRLEGDHSEQSIVKHYMLNESDFYMSENGIADVLGIEDKHGYNVDITFTTRTANYQREMSSTWGTISLPFSLNYNAENPVYRMYYLSEVSNNTLTFVAYKSGEIAAGTPMLIKRIDASPYIKISSEMAQVTPASQEIDCNETGWKMKGDFSNGRFYPEKGMDVYCISKNQFWLVNSEVNMPAFRAYFIAPSYHGAAAARTFDIVEEIGMETAVHIVEDDQENSVQLQFDLNGRISNQNASLRIVNGKCVMFK